MPRESEATPAAIKQAIDIVALVGEYCPPLHRSGGKFKVLCPFHDDHNPSLELNSERQSFKCWSCGTGGDVFDFVMNYDRVDFSEALRMLADRAGIVLDRTTAKASAAPSGPSKTEMLAVCAWAESAFSTELARSDEARAYVEKRGISADSVDRFQLGYAPDSRDWLTSRAKKAGYGLDVLESTGLITRKEGSNLTRDRFRGRLIFPIHDLRGRPIGFGGRILPESEKRLTEAGLGVAKYLNSPETPLFKKRKNLYAADLARHSARSEGWVGVVEGYTDVIAAHQAGFLNVVGSLGTALGDDHVTALGRMADRVVLILDGDEAGQKAVDRSLELFLSHEVDVRVLILPDALDPADFLAERGAESFRELVTRAIDPLEFILARAGDRYDFDSTEGARQAAHWLLSILASFPARLGQSGLDLKVAKALDTMSRRLGVPVNDLKRQLRELKREHHREARPRPNQASSEPGGIVAVSEEQPPIRLAELDPLDRELVEIALNEPESVALLHRRVPVERLRDAPLRAILQALYDLHAEGERPEFSRASLRLTERERALGAGLLLPFERAPLNPKTCPATWLDRLTGSLQRLAVREWEEKHRELKGALAEIDPNLNPDDHRALRAEYLQHLNRRPDPKKN